MDFLGKAMDFKLLEAKINELFEQWCKDHLDLRVQTSQRPRQVNGRKWEDNKKRICVEVSLLLDGKVIKSSRDIVAF
jgi:hypothetical protein